jgi:glycosyltransferase involved in cell wall biosynthesis
MIFDNPTDENDMNFLKYYFPTSLKLIYPPKKISSIREMVFFVLEWLNKTVEKDIIIWWYDFMGIIYWWVSMLHNKRQVIVLNLLLKNKKSIANKIKKILYKPALESKRTIATVTSKEYGKWINQLLGISIDYYILHDLYRKSYELKNPTNEIHFKSVFCGGRNGRDWNMIFKIAERIPNVHFICAMTKKSILQIKEVQSSNIELKIDIQEKEFDELLCKSEIVIMPLKTEAPAGLIVLFKAAANDKPIIASSTVTTREYLTNDRGYLCESSVDEWIKKILFCLDNRNRKEVNFVSSQFKKFLTQFCTEKVYTEELLNIINSVK